MSDKILVTGGAGFIGAHICEHILHNTGWDVIVLDRLSYAGSLERLVDVRRDFPDRISFVFHDFRAAFNGPVLKKLEGVRYIIHNGGETHVARSLEDAEPFVTSNVLGTMHVLNAARQLGVDHFIQISTDEVHGPAPVGVDFLEDAPLRPSNPYSATKAASEALAYSYWKSYRLPVTITRTMNIFGERQHVEKYVPMVMRKVLHGERVFVHGTSDGRVGSRKWLHARNQADALLFLLRRHLSCRPEDYPGLAIPVHDLRGETFHIAGEEKSNLEIAQLIADNTGKVLDYQIVDFHSQRPGHDLRYSLCDDKLRALGWQPPVGFEESLRHTVEWTMENQRWLADEKSMVATTA